MKRTTSDNDDDIDDNAAPNPVEWSAIRASPDYKSRTVPI